MLVRAPLMDTKQHGSIRIQDLTEVVMGRGGHGLPKERLIPSDALVNVAYADDRPCAFHGIQPAVSGSLRFELRVDSRRSGLEVLEQRRTEPSFEVELTTVVPVAAEIFTAPFERCLMAGKR